MDGVPHGASSSSRSPRAEHLRLLVKVARMYHERGLRQPQIAADLHISQPRVSRLLKQAVDMGVVRTVVTVPSGVHTDLEEQLHDRYGLRDAVVVDVGDSPDSLLLGLGGAAASYLEATLTGGDAIGISSWSATLLAAVEAMRPKPTPVADRVVQVVGGLGAPEVQMQATRLTGRLADLTGAQPVFMPSPGLVSTPALQRAISADGAVAAVMASWDSLTVALVGIGSLEPSPLLRRSGNAIAEDHLAELRELGAVGDICLRHFDAEGALVPSSFDERVVGISPARLRAIDRRVAVAGGERKFSAIRAALLGGWVNVLITDVGVAERLVADRASGG